MGSFQNSALFSLTDFSRKKGNEMEEEDGYGFVLDESVGLCSSSPEESGLGLLALFAARVVPSPVTSSPLSTVKPKAKQKARNKEDGQSLLGNGLGTCLFLSVS